MMSLFSKLLGRPSTSLGYDTRPAPDKPFIAIGDIHGRLDLLNHLMDKISKHYPEMPLVFLGDYIDRGPQSAQVLMRLRALQHDSRVPVVCILGNHEEMFFDFLDNPERKGARWLRYGGDTTADSFGASGDSHTSLRDSVLDHADPGLIDWLRALPIVWQSGNVVASHAGANPYKPIEARRPYGLVWGHDDFLKVARSDGLWIVHGHYPMSEHKFAQGRISIDTGAYKTDCLTAAVITPQSVSFLNTQ